MTEIITLLALVVLLFVSTKFLKKDDKKDENLDDQYENINLDDYKDYYPDIPDIEIEEPESNEEIMSVSRIKRLAHLEIFARTLYGEGRNLNDPQIKKIAWVIKNRVNDNGRENFPDNYSDVCLQPYQFSCWNSLYTNNFADRNQREVRKKVLSDQNSYIKCFQIAQAVYNAKEYNNPVPQVQHYVLNTDQVRIENRKIIESPYPGWVKDMQVVQNDGKGRHIFLA